MSQHKGESGSCPTVQIIAPVTEDNPAGAIIINAADFDPAQHERYQEVEGEGEGGHETGALKRETSRKKKTNGREGGQ